MLVDNRYPQNYFITSAIGVSLTSTLNAFDKALRNAGLHNYNLVKISSILPEGAVKSDELHNEVKEGSPLLTAYARIDSAGHEKGVKISTAVGVAQPRDKKVGVIMEFSTEGSAASAEKSIIQMLKEAMTDRGYGEDGDYEIVVSSQEGVVTGDNYLSLVSAITIW